MNHSAPVRRVARSILESEPWAPWNAFIDLIASEKYEDLTEEQRIAHLAFWYDSEVQNGGHLQYFVNRSDARCPQTIAALEALGAAEQAMILSDALKRWVRGPRPEIKSAEDFVATGQTLFVDLDSCLAHSKPEIQKCLERYMAEHEHAFIEYF